MNTTKIKNRLNALLRPLNLKIETLTSDQREMVRLQALEKEGYFDRPIVPVLKSFRQCDSDQILESVRRNRQDFAKVAQGVGFTSFELKNDYYTSPDAEVLYSLTRMLKPKKIIEVGAGG